MVMEFVHKQLNSQPYNIDKFLTLYGLFLHAQQINNYWVLWSHELPKIHMLETSSTAPELRGI